MNDSSSSLPGSDAVSLPTSGASTLDRALTADTSTGNRNLNLLLDALDNHDDALADGNRRPAVPLARPQPGQTTPARQAGGATAAAGLDTPVPPSLVAPLPLAWPSGGGLQAPGPLADPVRAWWGGVPMADGAVLTMPTGWSGAGGADIGQASGDADRPLVTLLPREWVQFMREHRYWLLVVVGVVAVLSGLWQARQGLLGRAGRRPRPSRQARQVRTRQR